MGNGLFEGYTSDSSKTAMAGDTAKWYWKDDNSNWNLYDADTTKLLEAAYLKNQNGTLPLNHGNFAKCCGGLHCHDTNQQQQQDRPRTQRRPALAPGSVKVVEPTDSRMVKIDQNKLEHPDRPSPAQGTLTERLITYLQAKINLCKKLTQWKNSEAIDHDCPICLCGLDDDVVVLSECPSHAFHRDCIVHCLKENSQFLKCPCCGHIYGVRTGVMPKGTMSVTKDNTRLEGYTCGTITINYYFADGTQGPEHPNPGQSYSGTSRTAYLPDDKEGNEVLRLLQIAWDRKLTFTIGTSVTSGASNTVVWNGVHHKTSTSGGQMNYGYPDDTYLERVTEELKDLGVV